MSMVNSDATNKIIKKMIIIPTQLLQSCLLSS